MVGAISSNGWSFILLIIVLICWGGYSLFREYQVRKVAKYLTNDDFQEGMRRAQVIDLREKKNFNAGHILGARNLPYSTLRNFYSQLRKDLPVYLYDQGKTISKRAAVFLSKKGYSQIFILKSGYQNWNGKEKKSDY